ncbi:inositol monophosphatase [Candidatus Micrarchaeota archaeon]|nr:inositol monophosphatase [Candidatus Micrarchaeota archaeon]
MGSTFGSELSVAEKAASEAGKIIKENFGRVAAGYKEDRTVITETDTQCEEIIKSRLLDGFPEYSFLGEETGRIERGERVWVVDPLDGTMNFFMGNPLCCVAIALVENGEPLIGVTFAPILDETFSAAKGEGATLNGLEMHVSRKTDISRSVVSLAHLKDDDSIDNVLRFYGELKEAKARTRQYGTGCLEAAFVASGRLDAWVDLGKKGFIPSPWDTAGGALLVKEAGGRATNYEGKEYRVFSPTGYVATNGTIHDVLLGLVNRAVIK